MDTSVLLIGIVLLFIILIPFYYITKSNKVAKSKVNAIFAKLNENGAFQFKDFEKLNNKVVAIDEVHKGFVVIDMNVEPELVHFVNLNEIKSCRLTLESSKNPDTVEKITFEFEKKSGATNEVVPFYDVNDNLLGQVSVFETHQLAKKWYWTIGETLK